MAKYKMTGCARFFIFLIIFLPLAYFGAQYLMNNGQLDGLKEKIENAGSDNSVERALERKGGSGDIAKLEKDLEKITAAYREQQSIIEDQQATINRQIDEIERLKKQGTTTTSSGGSNSSGSSYGNGESSSSSSSSTNTTQTRTPTSGSQSLDDLLKEADDALGTSTTTSPTTSANQRTIGTWRYSYSGVTGNVEFYEDRGKLFSKVTIDGDSRMDISELSRAGDRFTVLGSRTAEYYILKQNGDLDAYDTNGYQTTCKLQ